MTKTKRSKKAHSKDAGGGYEVGYGKPPTQHQFTPGHSGNPKGRPKGAKNEATILREIMHKPMEIREGGQTRKGSRLEGLLLQCQDKAFKGDLKALALLLGRYRLAEDAEPEDGEPLGQHEEAILEAFAKRLPPKGQSEKE